MQHVFVLDAEKHPLMPCRPARARLSLTQQKAAVYRRFPFTIILKATLPNTEMQPLRVKLDPGSKTTGIAVVNDATGAVIWAAELAHRGQHVKERLDQRRVCRRSRRQRHTRYRQPRFDNRTRREGWLPPSLESRIANVLTWVMRIRRSCPIGDISMELVKFDMALMQNAEISGVAYQQGDLAGYECRQYLLEKFQRRCAYCGKRDTPFEVEHIIPKSRGGSNRVSNLCLACHDCNQAKGNLTNEAGFPDKAPKEMSVVGGFRTGDIVRAVVPATSKKAGSYVGRIAIRATGFCNIKTATGTIQGIHYRHCQPLHRGDGYTYAKGAALPPQA